MGEIISIYIGFLADTEESAEEIANKMLEFSTDQTNWFDGDSWNDKHKHKSVNMAIDRTKLDLFLDVMSGIPFMEYNFGGF